MEQKCLMVSEHDNGNETVFDLNSVDDREHAAWQIERAALQARLDSAENQIQFLQAQLPPEQPVEPWKADAPETTYLLAPDETLSAGIRRIALEQADRGYWQLTDTTWPADQAVHDARKSFKRVRAVLRLVRDEIGQTRYRETNIVYRDASRYLSKMRDSAVMAATLENLIVHYADDVAEGTFANTIDRIMVQHAENCRRILEEGSVLDDVATLVGNHRPALEAMPIDDESFRVIQLGLERVYARGQRTMAQAYATGLPGAFHDWRKRVKYLRYQMRILESLWPVTIGTLATELDALSDLLGEEHDLFELGELAHNTPELFDDAQRATLLQTLIDRRRTELQLTSRLPGSRIYIETPQAFATRLADYWYVNKTEFAMSTIGA
jgi:CHAD domain-containing protein